MALDKEQGENTAVCYLVLSVMSQHNSGYFDSVVRQVPNVVARHAMPLQIVVEGIG